MRALREAEIVLEICPTSNLLTRALRRRGRAARDRSARSPTAASPFTIATDGPEMMRTHLRDEFELLLRIGALDEGRLSTRIAAGTRRRSSRPPEVDENSQRR